MKTPISFSSHIHDLRISPLTLGHQDSYLQQYENEFKAGGPITQHTDIWTVYPKSMFLIFSYSQSCFFILPPLSHTNFRHLWHFTFLIIRHLSFFPSARSPFHPFPSRPFSLLQISLLLSLNLPYHSNTGDTPLCPHRHSPLFLGLVPFIPPRSLSFYLWLSSPSWYWPSSLLPLPDRYHPRGVRSQGTRGVGEREAGFLLFSQFFFNVFSLFFAAF